MKILGNEKADAVAKEARRDRELQKSRSSEYLILHESKSQEREANVRRFYVPHAKSGINPRFSWALKEYAMR